LLIDLLAELGSSLAVLHDSVVDVQAAADLSCVVWLTTSVPLSLELLTLSQLLLLSKSLVGMDHLARSTSQALIKLLLWLVLLLLLLLLGVVVLASVLHLLRPVVVIALTHDSAHVYHNTFT